MQRIENGGTDMSRRTFPFTVTTKAHPGISVKIYRRECVKGDATYEVFTCAYYLCGQRLAESRASFDKAEALAKEAIARIAAGETERAVLSHSDAALFQRAKCALNGLDVSLDVAARSYAAACKILGADLVIEAARDYTARNLNHQIAPRSVASVCDEFIELKRTRGRSASHVRSLEGHLGALKAAFLCNIGDVRATDLELFFGKLKTKKGEAVSPKTHSNFRASIGSMFAYAIRRRYLPAGWRELDAVERMEPSHDGVIEIYTPAETARLLAAAPASLVPFYAIGAFAGLRVAEIQRLDWSEVRLDTGVIVVKGKRVDSDGKVTRVSKTGARRIVPITANLRAWLNLTPADARKGPVCAYPPGGFSAARQQVSARAGVPAKFNALRHSFVSYRLAAVQDVAKVALEAGNSPGMIFRHYREIVTAAEAAAYFAVAPQAPENIVKLPVAAGG
jgi:integrase